MLILTASFSIGCTGHPLSVNEGNKGLPPPSPPVSFMEKAVVLIFLLFFYPPFLWFYFTRTSDYSIDAFFNITVLVTCQPSCSLGKSAHHHHPPLMNFLGEAAAVSGIFLHCPLMFNDSHGVFYKLPGNGIAKPHTVHKGEK